MRFRYFCNFGCCFALALLLSTQNAYALKLSTSYSNDTAVLTANLTDAYKGIDTKLEKSLLTFLQTIPFVQEVKFFSKEGSHLSTDGKIDTETQKLTLFLSTTNQKLLADSLFQVIRKEVSCKVSSDCTPEISYTLTGPIHSYKYVLDFDQTQSFNGSFSYELKAVPSDSTNLSLAANLTLTLTMKNRAYASYIRDLVKQNIIAEMLTERELKTGFLIWASHATRKFWQE